MHDGLQSPLWSCIKARVMMQYAYHGAAVL